jgi:hypothetical protein
MADSYFWRYPIAQMIAIKKFSLSFVLHRRRRLSSDRIEDGAIRDVSDSFVEVSFSPSLIPASRIL